MAKAHPRPARTAYLARSAAARNALRVFARGAYNHEAGWAGSSLPVGFPCVTPPREPANSSGERFGDGMAGTTWSKFFWSDWRSDPGLRACSYAARGLWIDMLAIMADAEPIGTLCLGAKPMLAAALARITGGLTPEVETLLSELEANDVFSRDRHERIFSRRMVRDAKKSQTAQKNGRLGGNPNLGKQSDIPASDNQEVKPQDNGGVPPNRSPESRVQKPVVELQPVAPTEIKTPSEPADLFVTGEKKTKPKAPSKLHTLPTDWQPTEKDRAYARERGWSEQKIDDGSASFVERFSNRDKPERRENWSLSWCTWVRNDIKFDRSGGNGGSGSPRHHDRAGQLVSAIGNIVAEDRRAENAVHEGRAESGIRPLQLGSPVAAGGRVKPGPIRFDDEPGTDGEG